MEEKRSARSNSVLINDDEICLACFEDHVVEQFWNSIRNTKDFPFRWGNATLRFQDYAYYIPDYPALLAAYNKKKTELESPAELRIYCDRDETFVGAARETYKRGKTSVGCSKCGQQYCTWCKRAVDGDHHCPETGRDQQNAGDDAFRAFQRGKDYQLCPRCGASIALASGCNSLRCEICRRCEFCYICGAEVKHGDKQHWQPGSNCPRFNQPGAANALFDDQVQVADDDPGRAELQVLHHRDVPVEWNREFRARIDPARQQLLIVKEGLRDIARNIQDPHWWHAYDLVGDLSANYGLFMLQDNGELDLREFVANGPGWAFLERHQAIRAFADSPLAEWAWANFQELRALRLWYLNHMRMGGEEAHAAGVGGGLQDLRLEYGNPRVEAAFQGRW